jgi:Skp family chaperone for outer membrane proteins
MHIKYSLFTLVTVCAMTGLSAEDKQVSASPVVPVKVAPVVEKKSGIGSSSLAGRDVVVTDVSDILIGVCDLYNAMASTGDGKEKQQEMEVLQKDLTANLEQQRLASAKKLESFNAKKDTLSKEAREREEQELIALSRELQNEVQKAQERVRHELNKATEELAHAAEQAAVEIAKADKLDLLIEKNTGRVIYSRESFDVTKRVEETMNRNREVRLAQNKKASPATLTASAPRTVVPQKDAPKVVSSDVKKAAPEAKAA